MADKKPLCLYSGQPSGLASGDHVFGLMPFSSTTSLTIGPGSKTLTVDAGLKLYPDKFYRLQSAANPGQWMSGKCVSYSGTTLVLNIDYPFGSGTYADWRIENSYGHIAINPTANFQNSTAVLTDVPGLTATFLAGVRYGIEFFGIFSSNNTVNGCKINLAFTGTPVLAGTLTASISSAAVASELKLPLTPTSTTITASGVNNINTPHAIGFTGVIMFSTDTTATIQLANEDTTYTSTIDVSSCLVVHRLS